MAAKKTGTWFMSKFLSYQKWYTQNGKDKVIKFQNGKYITKDPYQIKVLRDDPLVHEGKTVKEDD